MAFDRECDAMDKEIYRLRNVMEAVASMPGKDWVTGQLALGEALKGGGKNLDTVLECWVRGSYTT